MAHNHDHEEDDQQLDVKFEQLSLLESEFEDAESEVIRKAEAIKSPLYKKRTDFIASIPHFWSLVFEQSPPEIDNFIQPTDSLVFANCLETFEVSRFEVDDPNGSPRSFSLKFGFSENKWFSDKTLEKKFWYRHTQDWDGLVSEPVKIHWKKGEDLTQGLTDAAVKLAEARKKITEKETGAARKKETSLPEYKDLAKKIETATDASVSFFGLFAFVSGYRWVSAEESAEAVKKDKEQLAKIRAGESIEEEEDEDDEEPEDYQETEVFPGGDEVATIIAEDMWPNALRYYKQHFEDDGEEFDDEDLSDLDVDIEENEESDEEIDIRALVGKGRKDDAPPAKKQRKA
jgi:hypothetical protein